LPSGNRGGLEMEKKKNKEKSENGLKIKVSWENVVSLGDMIHLCEYLDKNPLSAVFTIEIHGKDDVIR